MKQDLRNTKIRIKSEEHSKAFQESVFAAGGGWLHSGELYRRGINFIFLTDSLDMTYCDNAVFFQEHDYKEIKFPLPTKDIYTKHKEGTQVKQLIIHVDGLTIEEKQRVAKALAKIKNIGMCNPTHWDKADTLYAPSSDGINVGFNCYKDPNPTHSPQQVLEMAGELGHVHAELMAQYAEDAKTTDKPWELWQVKGDDGIWWNCRYHPTWGRATEYRHKPKTHIVNGVEIPDLRIEPKCGDQYWYPHPSTKLLCGWEVFRDSVQDSYRKENKLCYKNTEAGKQAAILHSQAMLGIA